MKKSLLNLFTIFLTARKSNTENTNDNTGVISQTFELFQKNERDSVSCVYKFRAKIDAKRAYSMDVHFVKKDTIHTDIAAEKLIIRTVTGLLRFEA